MSSLLSSHFRLLLLLATLFSVFLQLILILSSRFAHYFFLRDPTVSFLRLHFDIRLQNFKAEASPLHTQPTKNSAQACEIERESFKGATIGMIIVYLIPAQESTSQDQDYLVYLSEAAKACSFKTK